MKVRELFGQTIGYNKCNTISCGSKCTKSKIKLGWTKHHSKRKASETEEKSEHVLHLHLLQSFQQEIVWERCVVSGAAADIFFTNPPEIYYRKPIKSLACLCAWKGSLEGVRKVTCLFMSQHGKKTLKYTLTHTFIHTAKKKKKITQAYPCAIHPLVSTIWLMVLEPTNVTKSAIKIIPKNCPLISFIFHDLFATYLLWIDGW